MELMPEVCPHLSVAPYIKLTQETQRSFKTITTCSKMYLHLFYYFQGGTNGNYELVFSTQ
jgi:hypothetical protein